MDDPESIYIQYYGVALARLNALLAQPGQDKSELHRVKEHLSRLNRAHMALGSEPASVPLPRFVAEEAVRLVDIFERDTQGPSLRGIADAAAELAVGWERLPGFVGSPTRGGLRRLDILGRWPTPDQPPPTPEHERERDARGGSNDERPVTRG